MSEVSHTGRKEYVGWSFYNNIQSLLKQKANPGSMLHCIYFALEVLDFKVCSLLKCSLTGAKEYNCEAQIYP